MAELYRDFTHRIWEYSEGQRAHIEFKHWSGENRRGVGILSEEFTDHRANGGVWVYTEKGYSILETVEQLVYELVLFNKDVIIQAAQERFA